MRFIIFGPPGAGKGTYSMRVAHKLGIVKVSIGDIFRNHIDHGTELGKKIEGYVRNGALVPDETVIEVLKERIGQPDCEGGFILDGFPRTLKQAEALEGLTKIDAIVNLIVPEEILIEKLSARRICKNCGDIYNVVDVNTEVEGVKYILPSMSPRIEGRCDKCGGELIQRVDDRSEVVKERLKVYHEQSKPVLEYYCCKVPFVDIRVTRGPEIMVDKIIEKLKSDNFSS